MAAAASSPRPRLPWKTRIAASVLNIITDISRRDDGTVNRRLLTFLDFKSSPTPHPVNGVRSFDVTVDPSRNLWFRAYIPTTTNAASLPVMVFFHGGGFTFLSAHSKAYDVVCRRFARKLPCIVVSVEYRRTPEHKYPCQYEDGFDVLNYIDQNPGVLTEAAEVSKCFLCGDSAGANLAHHVAVRACTAGLDRVRVIGLVSIQPFFGGEERTEAEVRLTAVPIVSVPRTDWAWKILLPEGANRDHVAVNVSGPNAVDLSGLDYPETLVFVGGFDPLQDWQRRYYEWLKINGKKAQLVEYPNAIHAFYVFPELPESGKLFEEVKDFVAKRLAKLNQ